MSNTPEWFEVRVAPTIVHPQLSNLDPGEREAIELALELGIDTVLIDERRGRRYATDLNLQVTGTLGILEEAARLGKVDLLLALKKLEATNFRLSPSLRNDALRRLER
jgi:predicted nucleic acid-binding protein